MLLRPWPKTAFGLDRGVAPVKKGGRLSAVCIRLVLADSKGALRVSGEMEIKTNHRENPINGDAWLSIPYVRAGLSLYQA